MADVRQVIPLLVTRTQNGSINWRKNAVSNRFSFSLEAGSVVIDQMEDGTIRLRVLNSRGESVATLRTDRDEAVAGDLRFLWNGAVESYYRIESTISGIISELSSDEDVGDDDLPF